MGALVAFGRSHGSGATRAGIAGDPCRARPRARGHGTIKQVLITGSSGLIGSEAVAFFDERGWHVHGVDNNMRYEFFGSDGDTSWNLKRLQSTTRSFMHHDLDIRNRPA